MGFGELSRLPFFYPLQKPRRSAPAVGANPDIHNVKTLLKIRPERKNIL